jgi:hypothetical protein
VLRQVEVADDEVVSPLRAHHLLREGEEVLVQLEPGSLGLPQAVVEVPPASVDPAVLRSGSGLDK